MSTRRQFLSRLALAAGAVATLPYAQITPCGRRVIRPSQVTIHYKPAIHIRMDFAAETAR